MRLLETMKRSLETVDHLFSPESAGSKPACTLFLVPSLPWSFKPWVFSMPKQFTGYCCCNSRVRLRSLNDCLPIIDMPVRRRNMWQSSSEHRLKRLPETITGNGQPPALRRSETRRCLSCVVYAWDTSPRRRTLIGGLLVLDFTIYISRCHGVTQAGSTRPALSGNRIPRCVSTMQGHE